MDRGIFMGFSLLGVVVALAVFFLSEPDEEPVFLILCGGFAYVWE